MATNPVLQAVLLFQHHQTTTPYKPILEAPVNPPPPAAPRSTGTEPPQPFNPSYQPGAPEEHSDG